MRDDPVAAQTLGINLKRKKISCFAISAFFRLSIGGGLWAHYLTAISGANFYFTKSFDIVEISIIGGMFTLSGSILGAVFFTVVPEFLAPLESGLKDRGLPVPLHVWPVQYHHGGVFDPADHLPSSGPDREQRIILDSWFSKDTYLAPFRKSEYQKLGAAVKICSTAKGLIRPPTSFADASPRICIKLFSFRRKIMKK